MSSLSKSSNPAGEKTLIILNGLNFKTWFRQLLHKCETSFGAIGQNIVNGATNPIVLEHQNPGNQPSELDERMNAFTNEVVPGSIKYTREPPLPGTLPPAPTAEDLEEWDDDDNTSLSPVVSPAAQHAIATKIVIFSMPLTKESHAQFNSDKASHSAKLEKFNLEKLKFRELDDAAYGYLRETITDGCQSTVKSDPNYQILLKRPADYFYRTRDYLNMTKKVFSTGNVRLMTKNILDIMNCSQGDSDLQVHLDDFEHTWTSVAASLEDPEHPGFVALPILKFSYLANSINKLSSSNQTAINNYFNKHETEMLPDSLTAELCKTSIGNLATFNGADPISQQGSALIAAPQSALAAAASAAASNKHFEYGAKDPTSKKPHCSNCHTLTKNDVKTIRGRTYKGPFYFYHSTSTCNRSAANSNAKANVAAVPTPAEQAPAPPTTPSQDITNIAVANANNAYYAKLWHQQNADALSMLSASSLPP